MTGRPAVRWSMLVTEEDQLRPLYARLLDLRYVNPGGALCFLFFEGSVVLAVLLALAELVTWWAVLILPAVVAVLVKLNDLVAAAVIRRAVQVPQQERDRFRREMEPAVGRARVPVRPPLRHPGPAFRQAAPPARDRAATRGGDQVGMRGPDQAALRSSNQRRYR